SGYDSLVVFFFFSSRRRHTRFSRDWSSDVCSSDLELEARLVLLEALHVGEAVGVQVLEQRREGLLELPPRDAFENRNIGVEVYRSEERRVGKECRGWGGRCE